MFIQTYYRGKYNAYLHAEETTTRYMLCKYVPWFWACIYLYCTGQYKGHTTGQ